MYSYWQAEAEGAGWPVGDITCWLSGPQVYRLTDLEGSHRNKGSSYKKSVKKGVWKDKSTENSCTIDFLLLFESVWIVICHQQVVDG